MCHMQERGALVFEPRRFVELRKKPFWQQFMSAESTGMGIFYTLNVFCIQVQLSLPQLGVLHGDRIFCRQSSLAGAPSTPSMSSAFRHGLLRTLFHQLDERNIHFSPAVCRAPICRPLRMPPSCLV